MLNREIIKENLICQINDELNKIILLTGDWGTGKTFLINEIEEEKKRNKNYRIVSLFGVKDINELKQKLLVSNIEITKIDEVKGICGKFLNSFKGVSVGPVGIDIDLSELMEPSEIKTNLLLKKYFSNSIIVIDDLERKNDLLTMNEIYGFINLLENYNNVLILIGNEKEIRDTDWYLYKEKIVDIEYALTLSTNEAFDILFKKENGLIRSDHIFYKEIKNTLSFFLNDNNITNIRVAQLLLKKIIFYVNYIKNIDEMKIQLILKLYLIKINGWNHIKREDLYIVVNEILNNHLSTLKAGYTNKNESMKARHNKYNGDATNEDLLIISKDDLKDHLFKEISNNLINEEKEIKKIIQYVFTNCIN